MRRALNTLKKLGTRLILALSLFSFFLIPLALAGCASSELQTHTIYIPVKCDVIMPSRPMQTFDAVIDIINILKYSEEIETKLKFCTQGTIPANTSEPL